ncbi:FtsX-like permease family protein [Sphingomonas koreensis]|nr:FtsX-like permease family protein [Sphingomonas koreensis]
MTSALLTLYRSLTRHRLYAVLNIGGLALGLAVFLVVFLYVQYERGYDRQLPGWQQLWAVNSEFVAPGFPAVNVSAPSATLDQLKSSFHGLTGARFRAVHDATLRNGDVLTTEDIAQVDPAYFGLFPLPAIAGDPKAALSAPGTAVITQDIAKRFLGDGPALGKTITLTFDGRTDDYRVTAVLKSMPANMTYTSEIFVPLPPVGSANAVAITSTILFLQLPDAAAASALSRQLPAFVDRYPPPEFSSNGGDQKPSSMFKLSLIPLGAVHLIEPRDRTVVATLGVVGLLVLLIAIVNYVNLATARAGLRAREVALRKMLGGTRRSLVAQFLIEAIATAGIAALIALAIAELTLPFVNAIGGISLSIDYFGRRSILIPLALLVLIVGCVAGLYPALVLSRYHPAAVLASTRTPGGGKAGARLRQVLVIGQFAIAIAFSIGTGVLVAQTVHMRSADLGFRRDGLTLVSSFVAKDLDTAQRADLLHAFSALPGVDGIGLSRIVPGGGSFNISSYEDDGRTLTINRVDTGPDFFKTFGAHLLAGRLFDVRHRGDDAAGMTQDTLEKSPRNVIINTTAMKLLGFEGPADAIGKVAKLSGTTGPTIIGVVTDMRFMSPREPIPAILYDYTTELDGMVPTIRTAPEAVPATTRGLAAVWRRIVPNVPFRSTTADQLLYKQFYKDDAQRSRLFTVGAVLAVIIGCIGLYGLASFDTARRIKEIGIRKTLGASTRDIMRLLIGQFMRPVLLANLIAWPIAFFAMRQWLSGFDDRVALSPIYFLAATLVAIAIAALTVFGQAWRVARAEPARALRYE